MAERHRPQPVEHAAVDDLQVLDDRLAGRCTRAGTLAPGGVGQFAGQRGDRADIGLEAEQAWPDFVMQFERGAAALVVLRGDEPLIEPLFLRARCLERLRESVETLGDGGEFARAAAAAAGP